LFEFLTIASLAFGCDPSTGFCVRVPAGMRISNIGVVGVQSTGVCLKNDTASQQYLKLLPNLQGWRVEIAPGIRECQQIPNS
jgi:hypothetical protein